MKKDFYFSVFLEINIFEPAAYDPFTFIGLPKAWRRDLWNWLDAYVIFTTLLVLSYGTDSLSDKTRPAYTTTVVIAVTGLSLKVLGYMKAINLKCKFHMRIGTSAGPSRGESQTLILLFVYFTHRPPRPNAQTFT